MVPLEVIAIFLTFKYRNGNYGNWEVIAIFLTFKYIFCFRWRDSLLHILLFIIILGFDSMY